MDQVLTGPAPSISLNEAFRYCERLAGSHYENFTVGSLLIPKPLRKHVYAIYSYCRWVDDLGDEPPESLSASLAEAGWTPQKGQPSIQGLDHAGRMRLLDWWEEELQACYAGVPTHPALVALQDTIRTFSIPKDPFLKLIEANRMEQRSDRYATYDDLLFYCDHSANPVGRLFLYLFGYNDQHRQRLSDFTCTALQLANFWQDVACDYRIGRIYFPLEDLDKFNYTEADLSQDVVNQDFRNLMAFEVARAEDLFKRGLPLVDTLKGNARVDVALFTAGGAAVLDAIKKQSYDVLSRRPALSRTKKARLFLSTWAKVRWRRGAYAG